MYNKNVIRKNIIKNIIYKYITKHFTHASSHFFTASERKDLWSFFITFPNPLEQSLLVISTLNPDSLHNASVDPVFTFKFQKNNEQIKFSWINILTLKSLDVDNSSSLLQASYRVVVI